MSSQCRRTRGRLVGNKKFKDEPKVKGSGGPEVPGQSVPQLRVSNSKGSITHGAELCESVGETKCLRGGVGLLEVADFFFFLDRVQIKMLELPRRLFVSIF